MLQRIASFRHTQIKDKNKKHPYTTETRPNADSTIGLLTLAIAGFLYLAKPNDLGNAWCLAATRRLESCMQLYETDVDAEHPQGASRGLPRNSLGSWYREQRCVKSCSASVIGAGRLLFERTESQWRIKKPKNARTCRVYAMYPAEKNTPEKLCRDAGSEDVEIACQCDHPACPLTVRQFVSPGNAIDLAN